MLVGSANRPGGFPALRIALRGSSTTEQGVEAWPKTGPTSQAKMWRTGEESTAGQALLQAG